VIRIISQVVSARAGRRGSLSRNFIPNERGVVIWIEGADYIPAENSVRWEQSRWPFSFWPLACRERRRRIGLERSVARHEKILPAVPKALENLPRSERSLATSASIFSEKEHNLISGGEEWPFNKEFFFKVQCLSQGATICASSCIATNLW
jgi:hypothetical protein